VEAGDDADDGDGGLSGDGRLAGEGALTADGGESGVTGETSDGVDVEETGLATLAADTGDGVLVARSLASGRGGSVRSTVVALSRMMGGGSLAVTALSPNTPTAAAAADTVTSPTWVPRLRNTCFIGPASRGAPDVIRR
jgi:hypothetical protein